MKNAKKRFSRSVRILRRKFLHDTFSTHNQLKFKLTLNSKLFKLTLKLKTRKISSTNDHEKASNTLRWRNMEKRKIVRVVRDCCCFNLQSHKKVIVENEVFRSMASIRVGIDIKNREL